MKFLDLLRMSSSNLWKRKVRTILTVLGVVIGVASIVVMISLGLGLSRSLMEEYESYGSLTEITVYEPYSYDGSDKDIKRLDDELVATIKSMEHVDDVYPVMQMSAIARYGAYQNYLMLRAMPAEAIANLGIEVGEGSLPSAADDELKFFYGYQVIQDFSNAKTGAGFWQTGQLPDIDMMNDPIFIIFDTDAYWQSQAPSGEGQPVKPPKKYLIEASGVQLTPPEGRVVANADDKNTMDALAGLSLFTFGFSEGADCRAENLTWRQGRGEFDIVVDGALYTHLSLDVAGRHNVYNALAAAAAAYVLGVPGEAVRRGLEAFSGAGRRFEYKGEVNGARIYDDYAHHPGELHALLEMARTLDCRRVICAFQPHTYTRTRALFDDFVRELKAADVVVLTEIFAAREINTIGISSRDLAAQIPGALYCPTLEDAAEKLRELAQPGDLILTVGAGDIYTVGEALAAVPCPACS